MDSEIEEKINNPDKFLLAVEEKFRAPYLKKGIPSENEKVVYYNKKKEEYIPEPKTAIEAWDFIENCLAPIIMEGEKLSFEYRYYGSFQERKEYVRLVIKELEMHRQEAEKLPLDLREKWLAPTHEEIHHISIFESFPNIPVRISLGECVRLMTGRYYRFNKCYLGAEFPTEENHDILQTTAAVIYGKYFLFYDFLKNILKEEDSLSNEKSVIRIAAEKASDYGKPYFNPQAIPDIYDILKSYFPKEQQPDLERLLEEGKDTNQPLYFMDKGNRLAYAFRLLKEADIITGCNKKELQDWLCRNFIYRKDKNEQAEFTSDYAKRCFTQKEIPPCKNPLPFEIQNGKIAKTS